MLKIFLKIFEEARLDVLRTEELYGGINFTYQEQNQKKVS